MRKKVKQINMYVFNLFFLIKVPFILLFRMNSFSSAEQSENELNSEASFQKLSQTIATSIQKIHQNGTNTFFLLIKTNIL